MILRTIDGEENGRPGYPERCDFLCRRREDRLRFSPCIASLAYPRPFCGLWVCRAASKTPLQHPFKRNRRRGKTSSRGVFMCLNVERRMYVALIDARNLSFSYEGSAEAAFENVSLQLDTNWRLGLVGRNGRGKTTLLRRGAMQSASGFQFMPTGAPLSLG